MRILITLQGAKMVNEIEDPHRPQPIVKINPSRSRNKSHDFFGQKNFTQHDSKTINKTSNSFLKLTKTNTSQKKSPNKTHKKIKKISLKSRIEVPGRFLDLYEKKGEQQSSFLSPARNFLPSLKMRADLSDSPQRLYTFSEIIPKNKIKNIKTELVRKKMSKDISKKITEKDFRTSYQEDKDELEQFEKNIHNPRINLGKINLIQYLNEKEQINSNFINSLAEASSNRLDKVDKICQITLQENKERKLINEKIKEKIKKSNQTAKLSMKKKFNKVRLDVNEIKNKLDKYSSTIDYRERYKLKHEDMKYYWSKFNFEKLNKGTKTSKNETFYKSGEGTNKKIINI